MRDLNHPKPSRWMIDSTAFLSTLVISVSIDSVSTFPNVRGVSKMTGEQHG